MKPFPVLICIMAFFSQLSAVTIDESRLLDSYYNKQKLPAVVPCRPVMKNKVFYLDLSLAGHFQSDIHYIDSIDDLIDQRYNERSKKANALKPEIYGVYQPKTERLIFRLSNRISGHFYQRYSAENRWWNDFQALLGVGGKLWRWVIAPEFRYEEHSGGQLYFREHYRMFGEYKHFGLEYWFDLYNFYIQDDRDAKETSVAPYFIFQNSRSTMKLGCRSTHRRSRSECYSFNEIIPFLEVAVRKDRWEFEGSASMPDKNFKEILAGDQRMREDNVTRYNMRISHLLHFGRFFIDYGTEAKRSNLERYTFNQRTADVGWTYSF
ncbi:MAG: hypothetical protein PHQ23_02950 [Candidatus Wallbacteria bacterium]|nr:hypothetical protein [Candidatus Wallbacteria bacterium]